ncbi:tetratricopeptide repeat protein [Rhodopila globiformis]|uniref:tetratricopeptide repeat protein n=1 Tax=Rhodopila globiformis TaxID=1071 RepID=UPI001304EB07|nr:tetratricopeptide repeat protein [Rhodopila globiformis]
MSGSPAAAPSYHLGLGNALAAQGRLDDAAACYRRAAGLGPGDPGLHAALGEAWLRLGRLDEAAACFERESVPAALWARLGNLRMAGGETDAAIACYQRALGIDPGCIDAHNNLGNALVASRQWDAAIASFRQALALRPDFAEAANNLGNAFKESGDLDAAIGCYRQAVGLTPAYAEAHYNLANALRAHGQPGEAVIGFVKAIALRPDFIDAYVNLGGLLADEKLLDRALACYDRAIALAPQLTEAHFNRALALLAKGDLAAGWREYEWRWRMPAMIAASPHFTQPRWQGEAAAGRTLLIHAEQGFGDTLQFCRYAPLAAARGLRVILSVPQPLVRLLRTLPGVEQVVAEDDQPPAFDFQCPMLSLPLAFGTTLATIPGDVPYLHADAALAARWQQRLAAATGPGLRVGLVWAGSSRNDPALAAVDGRRSIAPERLRALAGLDGIQLVSLQKDGPAAPADLRLADCMAEVTDFADTAALVAGLDLVVSVDTAVAHLAAAMGKPVWLLDRFDSCWRWLTGRRDSPWYPSLRLYRQRHPGDWGGVIGAVRHDLLLRSNDL